MGSTQRDRYSEPTTNVAVHQMQHGRFDLMKRELDSTLFPERSIEPKVLKAICEYRLGDIEAIASLRRKHGDKLTPRLNQIVFQQEALGLMSWHRFDEAIDLMLERQLQDASRAVLIQLRDVVLHIRAADTAKMDIDLSSGRMRAPHHARAEHLAKAKVVIDSQEATMATVVDEHVLIQVMMDYMSLIIQVMLGPKRNRVLVRQLKAKLGSVDSEIKKSLPKYRHLVRYSPRI